MADLTHNGKIHSMEPLSAAIRLPEVLLDRLSREPLQEQIRRQLADAMRNGVLRPGCRLPSTRALARMLGVSRNTVVIAYESLAAEDLIRSAHGSGARVQNVAPVTMPSIGRLLSDARYPELITVLADPDGNPFYLRHPARRSG